MRYSPASAAPAAPSVGLFADRPAAGAADLYIATDGATSVSDGSTWYALLNGRPHPEPPTAGWTQVGATTATLAADGGSMLLTQPDATSDGWTRTQAAPLFTVTAALSCFWNDAGGGGNESLMAIGVKHSGNARLVRFGIYSSAGALFLQVQEFNSVTSAATVRYTLALGEKPDPSGPFWFRVQQDATNLLFSWSPDGRSFRQCYSQARASFLASAADQTLIFAAQAASNSYTTRIHSWGVT